MHVIGTAGHVDHGKSTLVRALTGIDPDRLQEEKERGMTLDLGFAWLKLPSGEEVSVVDVPGHERFIKNMLAGVGGIDLALLIVAADEGVMPQTREHLAILDLLQVKRGIAVLTKADLVEPDFLELAGEEVRELLVRTSLAGSSLVATSATTRQGLPELIALIDKMLQETPQRPDLGRPRLPIDRAFTISGFGTVVTGTLIDGSLTTGQEVEIVPGGLRARVRGLQSHRKREEKIGPGTRTAVNLAGLDASQLRRGLVLAPISSGLKPTNAADVRVRMVSNAPGPLRHNQTVTMHWLAVETLVRVRVLEGDLLEPGQEGWCQLLLEDPLPLVKGDFFVLRSTVGTLGGGQVVEVFARRHKRGDAALLDTLEALAGGNPQEIVRRSLEASSPLTVNELAERAALPREQVYQVVTALVKDDHIVAVSEDSQGALLYSRGAWEALKSQAAGALEAYHRQYPLRRGMSREELRSRLRSPAESFPAILQRLASESVLADDGSQVRLSAHQPRLTEEHRRQVQQALQRLRGQPYTPPDLAIEPELLTYLAEQGEVVPVGDGIVYLAPVYREMVDKIGARAKEKGTITIADVRDMFGTSRKYSLALLEYLDQQHITRRVGDERVLL